MSIDTNMADSNSRGVETVSILIVYSIWLKRDNHSDRKSRNSHQHTTTAFFPILLKKENQVQVCFLFCKTRSHIRAVVDEILPSVRGLYPLEKHPGVISLLAGKPNPSTFPFDSISFTAKSPSSLNPQEELKLTLDGDDLSRCLQYGDTAGLGSLINWFRGLQEVNHGRKRNEGWRISMGSGSQDLIYKVRHPTPN